MTAVGNKIPNGDITDRAVSEDTMTTHLLKAWLNLRAAAKGDRLLNNMISLNPTSIPKAAGPA